MKKQVIIFILLSVSRLNATLIGSNLSVLRQGAVTFIVDLITPNEIRGFVKMEDGFSLNSSSVECEFNAFFPVKGDVELNGGTLNLSQDLIFDNPSSFLNLGDVIASSPLQLSLSTLMTDLGSSSATVYTFENVKLILNSNITLNSFIRFEGECVIDGNKNLLDLSSTASIIVGPNTRLTIRDVFLEGINNINIRCDDDTGVIILEDVIWTQDGDFQFKNGALQFSDVKMGTMENGIFAYQSAQTSTILNDSRIKLDASITFSYDSDGGPNCFAFESETSRIEIDGATLHITLTGMQLKKGFILVKRDAFIETEKTEQNNKIIDNGLTLGSGLSSDDDVSIEIESSIPLIVSEGTLNYKNILSSSLNLVSERSILRMKSGTILRLFKNMNLNNGLLTMEGNTRLIRKNKSKVVGSMVALGPIKYTEI